MRLFLAVALEDAVKRALRQAQRALASFDSLVRWTTQDQMHLTLKFLGEVEDGRVPDLSAAAECSAAESSSCTLMLAAPGCFPPRGRVRVVWAGLEEPTGVLASCQVAAEEHFGRLGFPREARPFSPHLTLGRVRDDRSDGALRRAVAEVEIAATHQPVTELCLFQSTLTPQGARYAVVSRHPLGEAG